MRLLVKIACLEPLAVPEKYAMEMEIAQQMEEFLNVIQAKCAAIMANSL